MRFLVWATEGMSGADIEMMVDAGKRFLVLHKRPRPVKEDGGDHLREYARIPIILEALRRQAVLNARMFGPERASLLVGNIDDLNHALQEAKMSQAERGVVLGLSQSAVSRRAKRIETGEAQREASNG
jgi:hypothetical protein